MAKSNLKKKHLQSIPGGKDHSAVSDLLSGRVSRAPKTTRRRKDDIPPQELPKDMEKLCNLFAAARTIKKEVETKEFWARTRIDEYCLHDYARRYSLSGHRPPSIDYTSRHSKFKFVLTARTSLTPDKEDALHDLNIPLEEHTELTGLEINYDAIRQHGLEGKLREALESMKVGKSILNECFRPKVQLKDTFYDRLAELVRGSLRSGEDAEEKMFQILQILEPTQQIRNVDVIGLTSKQCFDLVTDTEIEAEEEIA